MVTYSSRDMLMLLHQDGWIVKIQRGSHLQLIHPTKAGKVTVPHPRKELDPATAKSIFRQANLNI